MLHAAFCILSLALLATASRTSAQSMWGSALSFDGVNDYVQAGSVPLANSSFTLEAWARRDTTGTMDMIVAQGNGAVGRGLMFGYHWFGFDFDFYGDGVSTTSIDNAWHHWAGTYNATNRVRCLYRDGVLMASNVAAQDFQGSGPLRIGGEPFDDPASFAGAIDDVRIWNVARSQPDIVATMSSPLTGSESNLLAYWRFDEAAGTTAFDATSNGFNGTLVNGPSWTNSTVPQAPFGWGSALAFDGIDDYVSATIPTLASNYTISAWVYLRANGNGNSSFMTILSSLACNGSAEMTVHSDTPSYTDPQYLHLDRCGSFGGTPSTVTVPTNQWVQMTTTVTSNKQVSYFINGLPAGSWNGSAYNLALGPNIVLGNNYTAKRKFNGLLDEVQLWSVVRSQADIQAAMVHPLTGREPNLLAYWRLDEGAGTNAFDATGNGFTALLVNGPSWTNSLIPVAQAPASWGMALAFDGLDDYVDLGTNGLILGTNFTEEAWIYPQITDTNWHGILGYQPAAGVSYRSPSIFTLGATNLQVGFGTGSGWTNYLAMGVLQTNIWNHVAATYDGAAYRLYVNGSLVLSTNCTAVPYATPLRCIGTVDKSLWFPGRIDEFRIWNVTRTASQIQSSMWHPITNVQPGLVCYCRFDEIAGVLAYDATASRKNGTLNNRPMRVPSTVPTPPIITLYGASVVTNQYNVPFVDPGATAGAGFVSFSTRGTYPSPGYTLALKADGTFLGWNPQTGVDVWTANNIHETNIVAVAVGELHNMGLRADGSVSSWGASWLTSIPDEATNGIVAIEAGRDYSLALKTNGTVVGWGPGGTWTNNLVQVDGQILSNIVQISAGYDHNLALRANGSVVAWGFGQYGGLITPTSATNIVAISAGGWYNLALKADGAVIAWGFGPTNVPAGVSDGVIQISAGHYPYSAHCLALKADGSTVAWGDNSYGQNEIPPSATSGVGAVAAANYYDLALKTDGSIIAWGDGAGQQPGCPTQRTLCPGLTITGTVNVSVPGTYLLTYTVTNALGKVGIATRTVVVPPDVTAPVLPAQVVLTASPGTCQAALTPITATDDADPNPVVTCVPPFGTWLPLGLTNALCIATDASGNSRTGSVQVLINGSGQSLAPAGSVWSPSLSATQGGGFVAIACSTNGTRLVAAQNGGPIYTSADGGVTWAARDTNRNWTAVASSADGFKLVAADAGEDEFGGFIYTSTDAGATWVPRFGSNLWTAVASSADGSRLLAVAERGDAPRLWGSTDSGANWAQNVLPAEMWQCCFVALSADGSKAALASTNAWTAGICTSADGGRTWAQLQSAPGICSALALSADGNTIIAGKPVAPTLGNWSEINLSTDEGITWTPHLGSNTTNWYSFASSADGTKLFAVGGSQVTDSTDTNFLACLYFSGDSGATWNNSTTSASWSCVASSADGSKLFAGTFDGQIYVSVPTLVPPPTLTFAGATNRVVALAGPGGTAVNLDLIASGSYQCQSNLPVACVPASGSYFPAGTNLVTCAAVDSYGFTYTTNFLVEVLSTNPPTDILLSNTVMPENQPVGTTVGTLTAVDEAGDVDWFSLVAGPGDTDNSFFAVAGTSLQTAGKLSFKYKNSYSIRVRATDSGGLSVEKVFAVAVTDLNDAPVLDVAKVPALRPVGINAGIPAGAVGTAVTQLVDTGGPLADVTDDDTGAVTGVAITGADTSCGTWYFTTNGGASWAALSARSDANALLLSGVPGNRVYLKPATNFVGTVPAALAFRAWDQTSGSSGGTADTSSNGWTSAFSAAVGMASQDIGWGYALAFDGTNDHLVLPPATWFSNDLTIEAWVFQRKQDHWSRLLDFGNGPDSNNVLFALSNDTNGIACFQTFSNATRTTLALSKPLPTNQWVHLAVTLQGATGTLYTNGVPAATNTAMIRPPAVTRRTNYVARSNWSTDAYANAVFDELRIWNLARTRAQLTNSLFTTLSGSETGLVAYYRFDEGSGFAAPDATTNHFNAMLTNGPLWVHSTVPYTLSPFVTNIGGTFYVQGYWPNGVVTNATLSTSNLVVGGLSGNIQPSSGISGISFTNQFVNGANGASHNGYGDKGGSGPSGTSLGVTFNGGGAKIATTGTNAYGVLVASTGGSGGAGGQGSGYIYWKWGIIPIPKSGTGGNGGAGGNAGAVTLNSSGDVATSGNNSHGLMTLSQAGDGGNGGNGEIMWGIIGKATGGAGGAGGKGGTAVVTGNGNLSTSGDNSDGILVVSQGGKGGNGGSVRGLASWGSGGSGGAGGLGGDAIVSGSWNITTQGTNAPGISANSLGGTGGQSGSSGWITGSGGTGGNSGNPGAAKVQFGPGSDGAGGMIETFGQDSHGILAQSIGGYAGIGGKGRGIFYSAGGDGGSAGNGGSASIANSGRVTTHGQGAHGLFAQSVGGGGGSSGSGGGLFGGSAGTPKAGGNGGAVTVTNSGVVRTEGYNARGIFAQSVGGSGGNAGFTANFIYSIGASGGLGGNGGSVNVNNTGTVTTTNGESSAVFAQSVGGGGGTGGGSAAGGVIAGVAVGGSGGGGGSGGRVTVTTSTNSSISTGGTNSHGIFAQSVGGGGGQGGFSASGSAGPIGAAVSLGGSGGSGGSGGNVVVTSGSTIETHGTNAVGIFAQSVGGGGGRGGFSIGVSGGSSYAGSLTIGGKGGGGGTGDSVAVTNTGSIHTTGERSYGIQSQSVGGGGGDGGFSLATSLGGIAALPVSLGGSAGDGGGGNAVQVDNRSSITTEGLDAHGILAQSVGGGGGSGGFSASASGSGGMAAAFSMGGSGGKGGNSDSVTVRNFGELNTFGDRAYGILAQSVGGGGGDGGFSAAASGGGATLGASVGGSGGGGGKGSAVVVTNSAKITTRGTNAHGIFAQSVGGGGGSGGFSATAGGGAFFSGTFSMGGGGGIGGNAGSVSVGNGGDIVTTNFRSYGILAQSVGGGGGDGGFSVSVAGAGNVAISAAVGGSGTNGGNGSTVVVNNTSAITTHGTDAHGIFAQSVGGGGGAGGFSVAASGSGDCSISAAFGGSGGAGGNSDAVSVKSTGAITTTAERSYGILAQSVGGGGGDGGFGVAGAVSGTAAIPLSFGGKGASGGLGSTVTVDSQSVIHTSGNDSHGVFAQSVGGGGGSGGFSVSGSIGGSAGISAAFGGSGSGGANAGNVSVTATNAIVTAGHRAYGILAQSVGGGGGDGGFAVAASAASKAAVSLGIGGSGGSGGVAGTVDVVTHSDITTGGTNAHGIFAQSVGGGGGSGGFSVGASLASDAAVSVAVGGTGGSGADANKVNVTSTGNIQTAGEHSYGLLAQSVGGGGGDGGFSVAGGITKGWAIDLSMGGIGGVAGNGAAVAVTNRSAITTGGHDAHGIFVQSVGGGGGSGGFSVAGGVASDGAISASMGGKGTNGGTGSGVSLTNNGAITTHGERSYGILAQSVGGGGGDGGFSVAGGITKGTALSLTMGGGGGQGGAAGTVAVDTSNSIDTYGQDAHGLVAQSVGGGGGSGGFSIAGGISTGGSAVSASIGGFGGDGADANNVTVNSSSAIDTRGAHAYGILAQSVGGGGGDGGFSLAGTVSKGPALDFGIGGFGAGGGKGGNVAVTNSGRITTVRELAYGILAQSIGGGGGSGGFSIAASLSKDSAGAKFKVGGGAGAVGGSGGAGMDSGTVAVDNTGNLETFGKGSHALFAQSVGGGGGAGGFAGALAGGFGNGARLAVGIGGEGGEGGDAGNVVVSSRGANITTHSVAAYGVFAQSVGGGGGDGGAGLAASFGLGTGGNAIDLALAIGRSGGSGGRGGAVTVDNASEIETRGVVSHGIAAQSVGGGGGNGGFSVAGTLSTSTNARQASVSLGGSGGGGGTGGLVSVTNSGHITTRSLGTVAIPDLGTNLATQVPDVPVGAAGILAQSIGGGGGNGGTAFAGSFAGAGAKNVSVAIGGGGGDGNAAGGVIVDNSGAIDTWGTNSYGILAQSVGGGGGNGGSAIALGFGTGGATNTWTVNVGVTVGGGGGNGGVGKAVQVINRTNITTHGDESHGIFAQSIGGGGGNGGSAFSCDLAMSAATEGQKVMTSVAVGGNGGIGNTADSVTVDNRGAIQTSGDKAHGIFAQSIGGGGGNGGKANTVSWQFDIHNLNPWPSWLGGPSTPNDKKNLELEVAVGGTGGSANNGGKVGVTNSGTIVTTGDMSRAVFAQSVGGGGGSGGQGIKGSGSALDKASFWNRAAFYTKYSATVGGNAGSSGDGDALTVRNKGDLTTSGYASTAIFAQSVGGGGGEAQTFLKTTDASGGTATAGLMGTVGIGGEGGAAGNGGKVDVSNEANINTSGDEAHGIFAQSVGGGGGVAGSVSRFKQTSAWGDEINLGLGLSFGRDGGNSGTGGLVTVTNAGAITTHGERAYGIFAQSVGGGGGLMGALPNGDNPYFLSFAGGVGGAGDGGAVRVVQTGTIETFGEGSDAIFAQSVGGTNGAGSKGVGGTVNIEVAGNVIAHGTNANGIFAQSIGMHGGSNIFINIASGTVQGGGGSGVGIRIDGGATNTVINHGTITTASGSNGTAIAAGGVPNTPFRLYRVKVESSGTNVVRPQVWISRLNGLAVLQFSCVSTQTYSVEYSSDLRSGFWTKVPVPQFTYPAPGLAEWIDDNRLSSGDETVENYGTVVGSVDLGMGRNAFNNYAGANLDLGLLGYLNLGVGNTFNNWGLLTGSGRIIGDVSDGGTFAPGHSTGSLAIDGSLSLLAGANLSFDLAGHQQGATYDFIHVANFVSFLGTLSLSLDNSFVPTAADTFTLMDFDSRSGGGFFTNLVNGRLMTLDGRGSFQVTCTANSLQISDFRLGTNSLSSSALLVTNALSYAHAPRITSFSRDASGHMVLRFACVTNQNYVVEYTTNLNRGVWTAVPSPAFTWPAPGVAQWVDDGTLPSGLAAPFRSYRVRLQLTSTP